MTALTAVARPIKKTLDRVTPDDVSSEPVRWDWATAIPSDVPRAETIPTALAADVFAQLVPDAINAVQQVSFAPTAPVYICAAAGKQINHYAHLHSVIEDSIANRQPIQIDLRNDTHAGKQRPISIHLSPDELKALDAIFSEEFPLRINEDGNPWVVFCKDGVHCKVLARVERTRGLMHVIMSLKVVDGPQRQLPVDVRAAFNNQPLQNLSAAEALDALYSEKPIQRTQGRIQSFAQISSRDDYNIPTNFKRLEQEFANAHPHPTGRTQPALLASLRALYPGSPVLGDARALGSLLMQQQLLQSTDDEYVGWLVYSHNSLHQGGKLRLDIDLGRGPLPLEFTVPRP